MVSASPKEFADVWGPDTAERTELLVILTPRVLRSDEDARAISRELRDRMRGITLSLGAQSALPAGQP